MLAAGTLAGHVDDDLEGCPPALSDLGCCMLAMTAEWEQGPSTLWWLLQDATGRREVDQGREDARLRRIAGELAKGEETQRQWRVARGQVGDPLMC